MNRTVLSIKTPSKINIFLNIKDKMANGYHEIETIFLPLYDIFDKITIDFNYISQDINTSKIHHSTHAQANRNPIQRQKYPRHFPEIYITSTNDSIPLNSNNLCYRAATLYAKEADLVPTWNINIDKNIPIAAGMGGGKLRCCCSIAAIAKIL